jgi:hypothetical protein
VNLSLHSFADEVAARTDAPDGWNRTFDLLFPVKEPSRWEAATGQIAAMPAKPTGDVLSSTLLRGEC